MIKHITISFFVGLSFASVVPFPLFGQENVLPSSRPARNALVVLGQAQTQGNNNAPRQPVTHNRNPNTLWSRTKELFGIGENPEAAAHPRNAAPQTHQPYNPGGSPVYDTNAQAPPVQQRPIMRNPDPAYNSTYYPPNTNLTARPSPAAGGVRVPTNLQAAAARDSVFGNETGRSAAPMNSAQAATENRLRRLRGTIFERNERTDRRPARGTLLIDLADEAAETTGSNAAPDIASSDVGFSTSRRNRGTGDTRSFDSSSIGSGEREERAADASNNSENPAEERGGILSPQRPSIARNSQETKIGLPERIDIPAATRETGNDEGSLSRPENDSETKEAANTIQTDDAESAGKIAGSETTEITTETEFPPEVDVNSLERAPENTLREIREKQESAEGRDGSSSSERKIAGGTPTPGESELRQIAIIEVEVVEPERNVVGQESAYAFRVVNRGGIPAEHIELCVELPVWAEIQAPEHHVGSTSMTTKGEETTLLQWNFDRLDTAEEQTLLLHLIPRERKPLSIVWEYHFKQPVAQKVLEVLEPKIELSMDGPKKVLWGTSEIFSLRIQNTGNGDAEDLQITLISSDEPEAAESRPLGTLPAGEEKVLNIEFYAKHSDKLEITTKVDGPFDIHAEHTQEIEILRPKLDTRIEASEMQFVGNENEYRIFVRNKGTAPAENVEIKATLPAGAKYVSNEGNGELASTHSNQVIWKIDTIPVGEEYVCTLTCELRRDGTSRLDVIAHDGSGLSSSANAQTIVESVANLAMKIQNPNGPVEVGKSAVHTIRVTNRGTKPAENVDIIAAFSEGVIPERVEGAKATIFNDPHDARSGQVYFETIPRIGARQTTELKIHAKSLTPGNQKIRVEMICDANDTHLINEDSMHYYSKNKGVHISEKSVQDTLPSQRSDAENAKLPIRTNPFRQETAPGQTPEEKPHLEKPAGETVPEEKTNDNADPSNTAPASGETIPEENDLNLPPLDDLDFFRFDELDLNFASVGDAGDSLENGTLSQGTQTQNANDGKTGVATKQIQPAKGEPTRKEPVVKTEARENLLKHIRQVRGDGSRNKAFPTMKLSEKMSSLQEKSKTRSEAASDAEKTP